VALSESVCAGILKSKERWGGWRSAGRAAP
jgi:hypothetical protein